jgi:hypothetical protein
VTLIYHITHLGNLPSILAERGLCCDGLRAERRLPCKGIAHESIKTRRAKTRVPVSSGGVLADYVPFYFAPRSPMLYTIHGGNVEGYTEGQVPVVHLVAQAERVVGDNLAFAFTDGHAVIALSDFYDDLVRLDRVDWNIMRERYWADTSEDGDRKRRRQAEFLVHRFLPWSYIEEIGVINSAVAERVRAILADQANAPNVVVRRDWYY